MPGSAWELRERLSYEPGIVEICSNSGEMIQRKYGLHSEHETSVWIAGGISPWEMNRFTSELDRQIDHALGSLTV